MNYVEYLSYASEINELEAILANMSEERVIDRMSFESRLASARAAIAGVTLDQLVYKARLTFRGKPVSGSHGISADFAAKAAGNFSDAVAAIAAGINEDLRYMGPIPDKQKNQLLITGTTIGSFGFEFELPQPPEGVLFAEPGGVNNALEKMQQLFQKAAEGTDDEVAELVDEIHPRAVKKVADFLEYVAEQDAWCGLEFKEKFFRFNGKDQLSSSIRRLKEDNIHTTDEVLAGEFQGVLPYGRSFEFKQLDHKDVIRGKIGPDIDDLDLLNRNYLHKPVTVKFNVIQVGQGRPRYTLSSLDDISDAKPLNQL
ncbi:MAG: hypothetical protein WCJ56_04690 [bacterium]